ncbi:hypothetical protein CBM2634_U40026 [Cupriavidus taiwanensis]|uniref:Uncharacterized protein n=1 Tax=Cupriavidus taiwanensis TaxID=164546 RepID=A0A375JFG7_9BURK|nr:hypothetical protein CBM2634_U40026 [Cupriavidus taiwanensis]
MGLAEQDVLAGPVYIRRDVSYTQSSDPGDFAAGQARGGRRHGHAAAGQGLCRGDCRGLRGPDGADDLCALCR